MMKRVTHIFFVLSLFSFTHITFGPPQSAEELGDLLLKAFEENKVTYITDNMLPKEEMINAINESSMEEKHKKSYLDYFTKNFDENSKKAKEGIEASFEEIQSLLKEKGGEEITLSEITPDIHEQSNMSVGNGSITFSLLSGSEKIDLKITVTKIRSNWYFREKLIILEE